MAAGVVLMLLGVVALVVLMPKKQAVISDPARTVIWVHDAAKQNNLLVVLVESTSRQTLTAIPLPGRFQVGEATVDPEAAFRDRGSRSAVTALATGLDRQIHGRLFVTTDVMVQLADAAKGIDLEGRRMSGAEAIGWALSGKDDAEKVERTSRVFLALIDAITYRGVDMTARQGLALARNVDTNFDLMSLPNVMGRWSEYGIPRVALAVGADGHVNPDALYAALLDDPAPEAK